MKDIGLNSLTPVVRASHRLCRRFGRPGGIRLPFFVSCGCASQAASGFPSPTGRRKEKKKCAPLELGKTDSVTEHTEQLFFGQGARYDSARRDVLDHSLPRSDILLFLLVIIYAAGYNKEDLKDVAPPELCQWGGGKMAILRVKEITKMETD